MPRPWPLPIALGLVLLSAFANALAFPPFDLRPFAFVALVPLLLALRSGSVPRAIGLALLWAELSAWALASVFPQSLADYYGRTPTFGFVLASVLFVIMAGVYYAVFALVDRRLASRPSAFTPLLVAAAWVAVELARGRLFTGSTLFIGNPWGLQGYTHATGVLAQVASIAGVYGIGFVLVSVNAGIAGLIGSWRAPADRSAAWRGVGVSFLPVAAAAGFGSLTLASAPEPRLEGDGHEIAVVQGNVSIDRRWRSDYYAKNLDVYLRLTDRALRTGEPRLVIWPETSLNFFVEAEPRYRGAIMDTLRGSDAALLAGGPSGEGDKSPPYFNSVFLIEAERGVTQRHDKELLVPFSEYVPLRSLDWMQRQIEGARVFEAGPSSPPPLETPIGRVGVLICNEAMLPEVAADRVSAGAEILVSPSNDSWIRGRAFAEHMLAVVGLRAIEQRRFLVRASTAGPSAVVDPWGRVTARTDVASPATMRGAVRPERGVTVYGRLGDAFAMGCVIAVAAALVLPLVRPRLRAGRPGSAVTH